MMRATAPDICARCCNYIGPGAPVLPTPHGWVHTECASGADES